MTLSAELSSQVPNTIREGGQGYFRSGAVTLTSVKSHDATALVRGSERSDYEVDLVLAGREVSARCTCAYAQEEGLLCKHIWATILTLDGKKFAQKALGKGRLFLSLEVEVEDDDDYDDEERIITVFGSRWGRPPKRATPKRANWKDQLAALSREVQATTPYGQHQGQNSERQLLYVVDLPASEQAHKLVLEMNVQERKKNGDWSKPRAQHVSTAELAGFSDPTDRELIARLGGAERGDSYMYGYGYNAGGIRFRLVSPLLDMVLPLLIQSGRLRLRRNPQPPVTLEEIIPDLEPPWQLTVGVSGESSSKQWVLDGRLRRGDEAMLLSAATLLVPGLVFWNGRVGRLDNTEAFPWVPGLRKAGQIAIPVVKSGEFVEQLLQMPRLPKLDLPQELRFTEEQGTPRPRLIVRQAKNSYSGSMLNADLSFNYGGWTVEAASPGRGIVDRDGKRLILRDVIAEETARAHLVRLGARIGWSEGRQRMQLTPNKLPKAVRELVAAGWNVEAEGKLYRQPGEFKLAVRSESDWFDLDATASFEGQQVPLPRLLAALSRGENSIVLDDGTLGMVPEEWLKKYGLIAKMGTIEGDNVRFGKTQVGVLDALLASRPEVTFDEQFGKAREELNKFQGVAPCDPPQGFVGELRGYQREGLGWLQFLRNFGFGGCLADDMGLGKTVQVLSLLAGKRTGPALVVVPRSLVFNWKQEAARFTPQLRVLDHTGISRDRTGAEFANHDIVLTTYGTLRNDAAAFAETRFDTCVLDESQAAKNGNTETAKAVRLINADHRLALSGTPVENHLGELWTLFEFLNPGMLGRSLAFGGTSTIRNPDNETREILAKALRPFILRRTKDQVAKDLPAKTEQTVYCDLEGEQRKLYDELREHYRQSLLAKVDSVGLAKSKIQVLEALLRLRQAACHPGLLDKKRVEESSAKLDVLLPQLQELAEQEHKTLVFSQFTSLLAIVKKKLDDEKLTYEYLDGRTRDRAARVERFQTDPDCKLFLISLKAGGVGLNLTAAEYVFLLDPWWNPAVEAQAIDRSHRIGQTKPVFAYRLIAKGTVEEKVLALQQSKRKLADAILGGDGNLITDLKREDLELLLS